MTSSTVVANRAIKARPKATPDRIQEDIVRNHAIVDGEVVENTIHHVAETEELSIDALPEGDISVPLNLWLESQTELKERSGIVAVQVGADEDVADLQDSLNEVSIVVLPMVTQNDGRSYSLAYLLRSRYGYTGEIRATGYVRLDQLNFLSRVGCNAFELPEGDDLEAAAKAISEFSNVYQPSADSSNLVFARRRPTH